MSLRVSWQQVKAHIDEDTNGWQYEEPVIVILPEAGRRILFGLEPLSWQATYRIDQYDYSDWDRLQAIVDATYQGLSDTVSVAQIVEQLDRIATALEEGGSGEGTAALEGILSVLGLLDPRIAVLLQVLDSIETVLGGTFELPPPDP